MYRVIEARWFDRKPKHVPILFNDIAKCTIPLFVCFIFPIKESDQLHVIIKIKLSKTFVCIF